MTAPFLLDEMSEESACLAGRSTYVALQNHHRRVVKALNGQFVVTMEQPSKAWPKPFGYEITVYGIAAIIAAPMVSSYAAASTPRAG